MRSTRKRPIESGLPAAVLLVVLLTISSVGLAASGTLGRQALWETYKQRFLQRDGRVIDTFQKDFSHSEAQAYGLMLAFKFGDREAFRTIARWSRENLQRRGGDHLFCWSWGKRPDGAWRILNYNNASDADILMAWSLLRAGRAWGDQQMQNRARKIIRDIRTLLFADSGGKKVLLPGYWGFAAAENHIEYNPSYFIPAAFADFARTGDAPSFWHRAIADGLALQRSCRFGRFGLMPDWVMLKRGKPSLSPKRPGKYGFDAVRTWLWALQPDGNQQGRKKRSGQPGYEDLERFLLFCKPQKWVPAEVRLKDDFLSPHDAPAGFYMIYARAMATRGNTDLAGQLKKRAFEKLVGEKANYYSFSLFLLALY